MTSLISVSFKSRQIKCGTSVTVEQRCIRNQWEAKWQTCLSLYSGCFSCSLWFFPPRCIFSLWASPCLVLVSVGTPKSAYQQPTCAITGPFLSAGGHDDHKLPIRKGRNNLGLRWVYQRITPTTHSCTSCCALKQSDKVLTNKMFAFMWWWFF